MRELGYPDRVIPGLVEAFQVFFATLPFAALQRRARKLRARDGGDDEATKRFMEDLISATRRAGLMPGEAKPHPLLDLLVNALNHDVAGEDVRQAIQRSSFPRETKVLRTEKVFACAAASQAGLVLLRVLGFDVRPGHSETGSQRHAFDVVSLDGGRRLFVDFTLRTVVVVPGDKYRRLDGRERIWVIRSTSADPVYAHWSDTTLDRVYSYFREGTAGSLTSSLYNALACVYLDTLDSDPGALEKAVDLTERSVRLDPDSDTAYANFAQVHFKRAELLRATGDETSAAGELREARDAWRRAQRSNPMADYGSQIASAEGALSAHDGRSGERVSRTRRVPR